MKKVKQISYLSAIIIIIGSTIGAGIFFKNHELFKQAQGNLLLVIGSWVVAGIGMIALGLAIMEMLSASKTNRGTLEWFKTFMPAWMAKSSKNYVHLIFIPITLFTMPLYVVETWEEAGMVLGNDWQAWAIGMAVFAWIAGISLYSLKAAERLQWGLTILKFAPLIIFPIIALVYSGQFSNDSTILHHKDVGSKDGLLSVGPAIVLIGGVPAISFAFDGFYEVTSLRNDMKNPKKLGPAVVLGLSIIIAIYLFVTIAFGVGTNDGSLDTVNTLDESYKKFLNIFVGIGIIAIVNGYMMGSVEQNASLEEEGEAPVLTCQRKLLEKLGMKNLSTRLNSWIYIVTATMLFNIVFGIVGIAAWETNEYDWNPGETGWLYTFSDILVNYTSGLMFGLITIAVIYALINRFTNKVKVEKKVYFIPATIIAIVIIGLGITFMFIVAFTDAFGYKIPDWETQKSSIISLSILLGIVAISIGAGIIENKFWKEEDHKMIMNDTEFPSEVETG